MNCHPLQRSAAVAVDVPERWTVHIDCGGVVTLLDTGVAASGTVARLTPGVAVPGAHCDLVTVPFRQGLEAVDLLRLWHGTLGPVLHDGACHTLGFLVPPGTAAGWDVPGSACTGGTGQPPMPGGGWLVPPDAYTHRATEPSRLRAALGQAARTMAAVDRCR